MHHLEFEESGLKKRYKKMVIEKRAMYDHHVTRRRIKWSGKSVLKKNR